MKTETVRLRRKPLTASQYLFACEARRNAAACRLIDFRDACIVTAWKFAAMVALATAAGGAMHVFCLFAFPQF